MIVFLLKIISATDFLWDPATETLTLNTTTGVATMAGATIYDKTIRNIIIIGKATKIIDYFYSSSHKLESVIADNIYTIGVSSFSGCSSLKYFRIPAHCTNIGSKAFKDTALKKVIIPRDWYSIDSGAFQNSSLKSVIFYEPKKNYIIDSDAFDSETLEEVVYCGISKVTSKNKIFHQNLKTVIVPNDYDGTDFLGKGITKKDISDFCETISDDWFEDKWHLHKDPSTEIYAKKSNFIVIVVVICFLLIIASIIAIFWPKISTILKINK